MPFFTRGWGDPMNNNQLIREADGMEIDDLPPPPSSAELERWRDNRANQQPQQQYEREIHSLEASRYERKQETRKREITRISGGNREPADEALKKRQASPPTRENEDRSAKKSREATPRDIMPLPERQQRPKFRPAQNQQPIAGPLTIRTRSSTSSEFVAREAPLPYDEEMEPMGEEDQAPTREDHPLTRTETTCPIPQSYHSPADPADESDKDYVSNEKLEREDTPEEEETMMEKRARQRRNKKKEKKRANLTKQNKRKQDVYIKTQPGRVPDTIGVVKTMGKYE
ncbi:hypothetical protein BD779DRAFT_1677972 [Infundibulicybe gibba]|nr:hypothetical protein BD779DRAFT_1677972 [Infundibulicybe gibba]